MVWVAASCRGLSQVYFGKQKQNIDNGLYVNDCLRKRLLPFINKQHSDNNFIFFPDLTTSHYARNTVNFMISENIKFVNKSENVANVSEIRPIEKFWSKLKGNVYKNSWTAENLNKLRIKYCISKMDKNIVQDLMRRIDRVRRNGVTESK